MTLHGNTVTGRVESAPDLRHVQIAVLAKAPVPGFAKTRLIPALGAAGAARLHRNLALRTVRTALAADLGPVSLWCAPDTRHRFFRALRVTTGIQCLAQPVGDLGLRMHAVFVELCSAGPLLLVGTDCPPMTPAHFRRAALALHDGADAVFHPAEDGGYVLVGLRKPHASLFSAMAWSTDQVMADTRARARALGICMRELETLWDVDVVTDLPRLRELLDGEAARSSLPDPSPEK